ncbi:MAG: DNA repair protein RecO [Spirochaetales bacterium]|nr:DNA repair protein RecO [Spirochaetales bacterium]
MERDFKTLGIVLKKDNAKENDVVLRILTPDSSVLEVYVYGVRKSSKAVRASVFTEGVFSLSRRTENGKISLKDIDTLSFHEGIGSDLEKTALASLFAEMIIKGRSVDPFIYTLFTSTLDALESGERERSTIYFLVQYFRAQSLGGDWKHCPECQSEYGNEEILGFSLSLGAAVCSKCDEMSGVIILPPNARKYLARIYECSLEEALDIKISDEMARRISRYLIRTLKHSFPAHLYVLDTGLIV